MDPNQSLSEDSNTDDLQVLSPATGSDLVHALQEATRRVLRKRFRVVLLIRDAYLHMKTNASALGAVWDDLQTSLRLLVAWVKRSYREISVGSVVVLVTALVYFVTPLDVVPDTLGAIGFVDDITVITTAVETVRNELDQFRAWEDETKSLSS